MKKEGRKKGKAEGRRKKEEGRRRKKKKEKERRRKKEKNVSQPVLWCSVMWRFVLSVTLSDNHLY